MSILFSKSGHEGGGDQKVPKNRSRCLWMTPKLMTKTARDMYIFLNKNRQKDFSVIKIFLCILAKKKLQKHYFLLNDL